MSSLLFSTTCLNPIQGLIDFTLDTKPFHTKILTAGVQVLFEDNMDVDLSEESLFTIHQNFNLHTDHCVQPPDCCIIQGLETSVIEDSMGLEYVGDYSIVSDPYGLQIDSTTNTTRRPIQWFIGYNSAGIPVFYDFPHCDIEPKINVSDSFCAIGFEVYPYETDGYEFSDPKCEVYCEENSACELGLEEYSLEVNQLESGSEQCEAVCGYAPNERIGLEVGTHEQYPIEYVDPIPSELWPENYYGPCTVQDIPCPDVSQTTVSTGMYESFMIYEDGVLLLEL
jgi:hypothetical protein